MYLFRGVDEHKPVFAHHRFKFRGDIELINETKAAAPPDPPDQEQESVTDNKVEQLLLTLNNLVENGLFKKTVSLKDKMQLWSLPPMHAVKLATALAAYAQNRDHFPKVASALESISPAHFSHVTEDGLHQALVDAQEIVRRRLNNHMEMVGSRQTKKYPLLANPGFVALINNVFSVSAEHDWKPRKINEQRNQQVDKSQCDVILSDVSRLFRSSD
ncbi:MAG: hypothetical protein HY537_05955 [Deltaproteobacteria bacterium]|nr:hypothetical protein [Deltaproteobacteria bacterium]